VDEHLVPEDSYIVGRVMQGETELFRLLVQRYEKPVFNLGKSFFRNIPDAEDLVQEVFLKAYRSLGSFEGRSRFSTWLYRIAYNLALNKVERKKEYASLADNEDKIASLDENDNPERKAMRLAVKEAVRGAVEALPERYRVCVDLYFFYDRSHEEIEAITGIPVNTVKSHVFRAKKMLKESLKDVL
jgi:RNA polymerase sigma-70 factor (ECF subfamily)